MRVFRSVLLASVCLGVLLRAGSPLMAQQPVIPNTRFEDVMRAQQEAAVASATNFTGACTIEPSCTGLASSPPKCDETTRSIGKYRIYIAEPFRHLFTDGGGCSLYQYTTCPVTSANSYGTFRLESPSSNPEIQGLFDSCTKIGRSVVHTQGSTGPNSDTGGTPVGVLGNCGTNVSCVKDSDFSDMPSLFSAPIPSSTLRREIHTEIVALNLTQGVACGAPNFLGACVRAGTAAPAQPKSFGEVQSKCPSLSDPTCIPGPGNDLLPGADSFFDVFVEVDLPQCGQFPGGTVYNQQALLIENHDVTSLPPTVVYIHGNSSEVPVYFKTIGPPNPVLPAWQANDILGWLTLAGHGVGGGGAQQLETIYCAAPEIGTGACCRQNGTCDKLLQADCPEIVGQQHFVGVGSACTKCGACCRDQNRCDWPRSDIECHDILLGRFLGSGTTSCAHNPDGSCKDVGACCRPNNVCTPGTTADECIKLGGRWEGAGSTTCAHNAAGDCIPTVSEWGLLVMGILVLSAATVVIMRRRAIVRGGS
jgi:hypothetical protein